MKDQEFNRQYEAALPRGEFAAKVDEYVKDDKTALDALQALHERIQTLTSDYNCPKHFYFLCEDLCDLLHAAHEYYKNGGNIMEGAEFKEPEEL